MCVPPWWDASSGSLLRAMTHLFRRAGEKFVVELVNVAHGDRLPEVVREVVRQAKHCHECDPLHYHGVAAGDQIVMRVALRSSDSVRQYHPNSLRTCD